MGDVPHLQCDIERIPTALILKVTADLIQLRRDFDTSSDLLAERPGQIPAVSSAGSVISNEPASRGGCCDSYSERKEYHSGLPEFVGIASIFTIYWRQPHDLLTPQM